MKKELMEMGDTFCNKFCKFKPDEACKGPCKPDFTCPLETINKLIKGDEMNAEKTLKRIKEQIEWCDDIQNNNDESPESKQTAKRIAYDFIRKIVNEEGKNE